MLEQEFAYFNTHKSELVEKYPNRVIVIVGEEVVGNYGSKLEALKESVKKYEKGKFFIELCTTDEAYYHFVSLNWAIA